MSLVEEHKPSTHPSKTAKDGAPARRALGRGLDSLLPSGPRLATAASIPAPAVMPSPVVMPARDETQHGVDTRAAAPAAPRGQEVLDVPLDLIDENPYQTRRSFDEAALKELADSIKESGLAQPVVLRPGANGRYVLVLGERRCRASKLAGKASVPAIVRELGNEQAAELTVIENLQRQDLNCLEQAQAFARLSREFNLTQEQIGKRVGSSRESVANYMRLLKLPTNVLNLIAVGKLGFSEARVLLEAAPFLDAAGLEEMARKAVESEWTVKELKARVNILQNPIAHEPRPQEERRIDPNVADAERRLREVLGLRVQVKSRSDNKGQVVIRYESVEDFDRILDLLGHE